MQVFAREDAHGEQLHQKHGLRGGMEKRLKFDDDPTSFYRIEKSDKRKIEQFKTIATYYKISPNNVDVSGLSK